MKQSLIRRKNEIKNRMYDDKIRMLCRLKNRPQSFTRNRKILLSDVLLSTLNKQGRNISFEIRDYEINKKGKKMVNYSEEAYLKQRRQLNPEVFKILNYEYLRDFYHEKKFVKKYRGFVVWAIDGSKEEIPNTQENKKIFGIGTAKKSEKNNLARATIVAAYDVYNNFFGDVQIDKSNAYEPSISKKNIEECLKINDKQKNLFIFDRCYPSIELFEMINERYAKFVMRLSVNDYVREREQMKSDDEKVYIRYDHRRKFHFKKKKPETYEKIKDKEGITLRIVNIRLNTGEIETIITNIMNNRFTIEDFKKLYHARWKIEEGYNSLKNKLKIEHFTGKLPIYIYQDIYAQVLVYNQIQDILKEGNEILAKRNNEKNLKLKYQINENKAIGLYKEKYIKIMLIDDKEERIKSFDNLMEEMTKYVSAIREERKSMKRNGTPLNKYRINHGATF